VDSNKDGKSDTKIWFNPRVKGKGGKRHQPQWKKRYLEFYDGASSLEGADEEERGKVNLKIYYREGRKFRTVADRDYDGKFETPMV